jgi:hypothetical protein
MVMSGLALRSAAMCFLAWIAYIWPGPGSSEAMRLMAVWASVKIVTLSGVVCRLTAVSSAVAGTLSGDYRRVPTYLEVGSVSKLPGRKDLSLNPPRPGMSKIP